MPTLPGLSYLNQFYGGNQLQDLFANLAPPPIVQTQPQSSTTTGQGTYPSPVPTPAPAPTTPYTPLVPNATAPAPWTKGGITRRGAPLMPSTPNKNEAQFRGWMAGGPDATPWTHPSSSQIANFNNSVANSVHGQAVQEYYSPFGRSEYNMFDPTFVGPVPRITPFMENSLQREFTERGLTQEQLAAFLLDPVAWTQSNPTITAPGTLAATGPSLATGTAAAATNNFDPAGLINLLTEAVDNLGYTNRSGSYFYPYGTAGYMNNRRRVTTAGALDINTILQRLGLAV